MNEFGGVDCGEGVRLERGVRARMRDGVELVSDHYHPPQTGPQPTLLMRQPYGRDIASTVVYAHPVWFARHGYNVVIQDVRGRGDSAEIFILSAMRDPMAPIPSRGSAGGLNQTAALECTVSLIRE